MANTIKTRIKLRTDTLTNWNSAANATKVKIYKGEAALGLDSTNNKYIIKIGVSDNGNYWSELSEDLTIPVGNVIGLENSLYEYQLNTEWDSESSGQKIILERKLPNDSDWTTVNSLTIPLTGELSGTNPVTTKDYVDEAVSNATTSYFETTRQTGESDQAAINRYFTDHPTEVATVKTGSTFVIKTAINSTALYEYIAFTAKVTQGGITWAAMDGNYNAENVYFDSNFDLAGSYTNVGNIKLSDGTYNAAGKNLKQVLGDILDQTVQPTMGTPPSMSVTLTGAGTKEAGSSFTPSYSVNYTQGKYNTPWNNSSVNDGTSVTSYTVTDTASATKTAQSESFAQFTVTDTTSYKVTASVNYSAGSIAKTNKNTNSNPVVQRSSGSITGKNSATVTGGRYTFYGYTTTANPTIDSTFIRGLQNKTFNSLSNTNLTIANGTKAVVIAIPQAMPTGATGTYAICAKANLASIKDANDSNKNITDAFVKQDVSVKDASGANPITYSVYVMNRPAGLVVDTYSITA